MGWNPIDSLEDIWDTAVDAGQAGYDIGTAPVKWLYDEAGNVVDELGNIISGPDGGKGSPYGGGGFESGLQPYEATLYEGPTQVPMSLAELYTLGQSMGVLSGKTGRYREILEGDPDFGLYNKAVVQPTQRYYEEVVEPSIKESYSGGPGGAAYHSGARQAAEAEGAMKLSETFAQTQLQADQFAQQQSLQAASMLPGFMNMAGVPRQNRIANLERTINVHYKNEGLKYQEFLADAQVAQQALNEAQFAFNIEQYNQQLEMLEEAQDAAKWGTWGTLIGMGIGAATGGMTSAITAPMGMALGGMVGGVAGQAASGSYYSAYPGLQQTIASPYTLMALSTLATPQQSVQQTSQPLAMPNTMGNYSGYGSPSNTYTPPSGGYNQPNAPIGWNYNGQPIYYPTSPSPYQAYPA